MPNITGFQGGLQPALVCGGSPGQLNNIGFPCPPSHIQGFRIIQQPLHHSTALLMVVWYNLGQEPSSNCLRDTYNSRATGRNMKAMGGLSTCVIALLDQGQGQRHRFEWGTVTCSHQGCPDALKQPIVSRGCLRLSGGCTRQLRPESNQPSL